MVIPAIEDPDLSTYIVMARVKLGMKDEEYL